MIFPSAWCALNIFAGERKYTAARLIAERVGQISKLHAIG